MPEVNYEKIVFFCEFCQQRHSQLKITYDRNIKKNGRIICAKENGHIIGSLPKLKKQNPLAVEGEKKCNDCDRVLLLEQFSKGKAVCKECRAANHKAKYKSSAERWQFKYE